MQMTHKLSSKCSSVISYIVPNNKIKSGDPSFGGVPEK